MIENCGKCGSVSIHTDDGRKQYGLSLKERTKYYCAICGTAEGALYEEEWNGGQRAIRMEREEKMLRAMMSGGFINCGTKFGEAIAEVQRLVEAQDVMWQERYNKKKR